MRQWISEYGFVKFQSKYRVLRTGKISTFDQHLQSNNMSWTDFIYGIGEFLTWSFQALPVLGNNMNWFIIVVGALMMAWWIRRMGIYNKEAEQNNTLP